MEITTGVGQDALFELDEFSRPKLISPSEMIKNIILFILFSKPGSYPSLPGIGLDIQSYLYEFYDTLNVNELKQSIIDKCSLLEFYFNNNNISIIKYKDNGVPSLKINMDYVINSANGNKSKSFHIGISYDELKNIIYTIKLKKVRL